MTGTKETRRNSGAEARAVVIALGVCVGAVAVGLAAWFGVRAVVVWGNQRPAPGTVLVGAPAMPALSPLALEGRKLFIGTCASCHAEDGAGMPNSGKPLINNTFVRATSDKDLLTFIKTGRPSWDEANTTGVDMPGRGGNPALKDEDLTAIVAFVRSLSPGGAP